MFKIRDTFEPCQNPQKWTSTFRNILLYSIKRVLMNLPLVLNLSTAKLELYKQLGIEPNFTTAYHPQTNGQTKKNKPGEHYLHLFINYHQSDWHEWLPTAEFTYNDWVDSAMKVTPFFADMGCHPYKGAAPKETSSNPTAQEFADKMRNVWEEVGSVLKKAAEDMTHWYTDFSAKA